MFQVEKDALKGISIGIIIAWCSQATGSYTCVNYAALIFKKSGTQIDKYVSSIILAVALLMGSFFSAKLADSLGRKILILISLLGSGFSLLTLSLFLYLVANGYDFPQFQWIPVVNLSFVTFIASAGIIALRNVVIVEHLPNKVCTNTLILYLNNYYNCQFCNRFERLD